MTGAICYRKDQNEMELTFQKILLDETVLDGEIYVLDEAVIETGGPKRRMKEKNTFPTFKQVEKIIKF